MIVKASPSVFALYPREKKQTFSYYIIVFA